jgi:hypothetical protein
MQDRTKAGALPLCDLRTLFRERAVDTPEAVP